MRSRCPDGQAMQYIEVRHDGASLWLTFSRPKKANVLHPADLPALREVIETLPAETSAIIFAGNGARTFSGGMDVTAFHGLDQAAATRLISELSGVLNAIRRSRAVSVAAINGPCLGAAFELALACDLRVISTSASFGLPEIRIGIPSVLDAALLPQFVGLSLAREMILTGDIYPLARLPVAALANVVCAPDDLAAATNELVGRVAGHTRTVTAAQRRLFDTWLNNGLDGSVAASIGEFGGVFDHQDTHRQIDAYNHALATKAARRQPLTPERPRRADGER
jgi:enoyl-CoA hydratase